MVCFEQPNLIEYFTRWLKIAIKELKFQQKKNANKRKENEGNEPAEKRTIGMNG